MATRRSGGDSIHTATLTGSPLSALGITLPEWMDSGLCAQTDPEAWFPEKGGSVREAKKMCGLCPVAAECLGFALDHQERFGIWGGRTERERRRLVAKS